MLQTYLFNFVALVLGLNFSLLAMEFFLGLSAAAYYRRIFISYIILCLCALYGMTVSVLFRLGGVHRISQWATARAFKWTMRLFVGVRFDIVSGQEHLNERPVVFVGNHQTALDILLLATIFPRWCSVTAKKSLKHMPFLGWFMALSGTVFIDRASRENALKAFDGAATEMQVKKQSVFIFPEGTRSDAQEPTLLPFKKGAFHLAIRAGVPIVPIVAGNYKGIFSMKNKTFRTGRVPTIVLRPIPTKDLTAADVDDLARYTRDIMLKAVMTLTESPSGQQAFLEKPPVMPYVPVNERTEINTPDTVFKSSRHSVVTEHGTATTSSSTTVHK